MIRLLTGAASVLAGLLLATAPAHTAIIIYDYEGEFGPPPFVGFIPGISEGATFNGSFTVDGSTIQSAELNIPSASFSSGPIAAGSSSFFEIVNGVPSHVSIGFAPGSSVAWPSGGIVTFWSVFLQDNEGAQIDPGVLPAFADWDSASFSMNQEGGLCASEGCSADGILTSFSVRQDQPVSEPESLPLLLASLGLAWWFSRRRRMSRGDPIAQT